MAILKDQLDRPLHDVRISVIDRCNFRCPYCMPADPAKEYAFLAKDEWLTDSEILRLAGILTAMGVQKIRLTGGEPLLRPGLSDLIARLTALPGSPDTALTTNGSLLSRHAADLKAAGLHRLTVSLDTLDARLFRQMGGTQTPLDHVLEGIASARDAGFTSIKINVVVQKGVNDGQLMNLVEHFRGTGHVLRFIEYMDVGNCNHWERQYVLPSKELLDRIDSRYPLQPLDQNYFGEVARRYAYADGQGEIGFITSVTQPFCQTCTRLRITTDGRLVTCLFATDGRSVRELLRSGATDHEVRTLIRDVWSSRRDQYSNQRAAAANPAHPQKKLEMYQIGG